MPQPSYIHADFTELTGRDGHSPSIQVWGSDDNHATMTYDVAWVDYMNNWPGKVLGYSFMGSPPAVDAGGYKRLQRVLPLRHPIYPNWWASKITQAQPINPNGMTTAYSVTGDPYSTAEFVRCTMLFQSLPYAVLSDAALLAASSPNGIYDESLRFVEWTEEPSIETLEVPVGSLRYYEGPAGIIGATVPNRRYELIVKQKWTLRWHRVADNYLMYGGVPGLGNGTPGVVGVPAGPGGPAVPGKGILGCVNYVNATTFMGKAAGTLLVTGYKRTPIEAPTDSVNVGSQSNDYPARLWTMDVSVLEFNPPTDPSNNFARHGHNLAPAPGLQTPYWYYAADSVNITPIYGSVDFNKVLFKSPN